MEAERLLPRSEPGLAWWEPGLAGRRKVHLDIGPRVFQVTSSAIALPGEEERFYSVSLLPVAKAENADSFGTGSGGTGSRPAVNIIGPIR
jgi:hypothetical protein